MLRTYFFLFAWLYAVGMFAQMTGPAEFYQLTKDPIDKVEDIDYLITIDNMIYGVGRLKSEKGAARLFAVDPTSGDVVRAPQADIQAGDKEDVAALNFFRAGNRPAQLFRIWQKKTGMVTLVAVLYDPKTLQPDGERITLGSIPFDPKTYFGSGPYPYVITSPDGKKLLFCFDGINSGGVQLVMSWVTDSDLVPEWNAIYRLPTTAGFFRAEYFLDDEGSVYCAAEGLVLREGDIKEKKDGRLAVASHGFRKTGQLFYKFHEREFLAWDGSLPGNNLPMSIKLRQMNGKLYYYTLLAVDEKDDEPRCFAFGELNPRLEPSEPTRIPLASGISKPKVFSQLVVDAAGNGFAVGATISHCSVTAFKAGGDVSWTREMPWKGSDIPKGPILAFAVGDALYMLTNAYGQQAGNETPSIRRTGNSVCPILVVMDGERILMEDLMKEEYGGSRLSDDPHWKNVFNEMERTGSLVMKWPFKDGMRILRVPFK